MNATHLAHIMESVVAVENNGKDSKQVELGIAIAKTGAKEHKDYILNKLVHACVEGKISPGQISFLTSWFQEFVATEWQRYFFPTGSHQKVKPKDAGPDYHWM